MRPENILAWSVNVEVGAPPPSQPPFDHFGNPIVNVAANIKEWKREFQAQQAERRMQDGIFRQEKVGDGPKIGSTKSDIEAYIKDWRCASGREDSGGEGHEGVSRKPQLHLDISKTKPSAPNVEAHWNRIRKQNFETAEREHMLRQRKILFPNRVPKEEKPEAKAFKIPQMRRKPVPKADDKDTPQHPPQRKPVSKFDSNYPTPHALHPQTLLLRNGEMRRMENRETKTIEDKASYVKHVRELGYPEALCPLPMKGLGIDCTGAGVIGQNEERQLRHENRKLEIGSDGDERDRDGSEEVLTEEVLALRGEFRTLKVGAKRG